MSINGGYNSDVVLKNSVEMLSILPEHLGTAMYHTPNRKFYSVVNKNMVISKDIRLKRTGGVGLVSAWVLNFPKPDPNVTGGSSGTLVSAQGASFFYSIDGFGKVSIHGTFTDVNDELTLNIFPYIAKYPIEYHTDSPT